MGKDFACVDKVPLILLEKDIRNIIFGSTHQLQYQLTKWCF